MEVEFERARPGDMAGLCAFMEEYYAFDGHEFDAERVTDVLEEFLGDERLGLAWFIRKGGERIGYMALCIGYSLEFGGRDAFVDEIFLREAFRGAGAGRHALAFMIAEAGRLGVRALHLEVDQGNERAQALYRSLGFEVRERFHLMSREV